MSSRLIAEPLYHPKGGMNIDANGLTARPDECIDAVNVDITVDRVSPRRGTITIHGSDIVVSGAGASEFNGTYKKELIKLSGFSYWTKGDYRIYYVSDIGEWWMDASTPQPAYSVSGSGTASPPQTGWSTLVGGAPPAPTLSGPLYGNINKHVLKYHNYIHPTDGNQLFAFCSDGIYKLDATNNWVSIYSGDAFSVEVWSVTDAIDRSIGATVVAAASTHTQYNGAYTDSASRILLYYDLVTDEFIDMQLKTNFYGEESIGDISLQNSIDLTSATYKWTASGSGTNEFYCELTAGGDPSIVEPEFLEQQGIVRTRGTAGTLLAGTWDYSDNDTLGYSTVYVRMPNGADPDLPANSVTANYTKIFTASLLEDRTIVPGSAYLIVDNVGLIAKASLEVQKFTFGTSPNLEEVDVNRWIPVDENEVRFSSDSYIRLDTGEFSIEFVQDTYNGEHLYIYYEYEVDVDYKPLHVAFHKNSLIIGNIAEFFVTNTTTGAGSWTYLPWRIRNSIPGNIFLFRGFDFMECAVSDISPILGMRSLETEASSTIIGPMYIYKANSVVRATYNTNYNLNPELPAPFFIFELAYSEGVIATNTIASINGMHFYLGRNDIYAFNGVQRTSLTRDTQTGSSRIQRFLFDNINLNYLHRAFGIYDEIAQKYMLFVTLKSAGSQYPEDCFVFDLNLGSWVRYTFGSVSAGITSDLTLVGIIDELSGTIDELDPNAVIVGDGFNSNPTLAIDDLSTVVQKRVFLSIDTNTYYMADYGFDKIGIDQESFDSYFITRDFLAQSLEHQDRMQQVNIEARRGSMQVSYNTNYSTNPADFDQLDTFTNSLLNYEVKRYFPDIVSTTLRLYIKLDELCEFRWLQVFSNRQELMNK